MNSKNIQNLQEAYLSVYEPQQIEEGYDRSSYTWDEMYEIYEETAEERDARIAARRARVREMEAQGRVMTSSRRSSERAKQRKQEKKAEELERLANRALADTLGATRRSSTPMGSESPAPKGEAPSANRRLASKVKSDTLASRADEILRNLQKESFDYYDIILSHLLDEGYANDIESAEAIMVNMSEEWRDDIIEKSGEQPLPYGRMMDKSNELASSKDPKKQKRAATIYLAANAPKGPKVKVRK
jgi:hypothetical protein